MSTDAVAVVEKQLTAYNAKNAEDWAATYAEDAIQKLINR